MYASTLKGLIKLARPTCTLLFMLLLNVASYSQTEKEANQLFSVGNYFEAIEAYRNLLESDPDNPLYNQRLGLCYLNTHIKPQAALSYLKKAAEQPGANKQVYFELAKAYTHHLEYLEALESLQKFKEAGGVNKKNEAEVAQLENNCKAAPDYLKYPVEVTFTNMGTAVNTEFPDYHPFISKDENTLVFTSRRKSTPSSLPEFDGYYPSDIFESVNREGTMQLARGVSDRINTAYDEQCVGLSDSGDTLYIYIDHIDEFGDIYSSTRKNGVFSPVNRVVQHGVNSMSIESSFSISPDKKTVLFASDRDGGMGGFDIWMIRKLPDGSWGAAQNMGPEINSPLNEDFPTFSGDGKTVYFCSEGHAGMGGYDIFYSIWDPQFNIWTAPQNIGYPLNTPADNKTISFNQDGTYAYVAANREDSYGDMDIYQVRYEKKFNIPAIFRVNVNSREEKNLKPEIQIKNEYDELVGQYLPASYNGRYTFALYPGRYIIYIDAEGYKPYNEVLVVNEFHTSQEQNIKTINLSN